MRTTTYPKFNGFASQSEYERVLNIVKEEVSSCKKIHTYAVNRLNNGSVHIVLNDVSIELEKYDIASLLMNGQWTEKKIREHIRFVIKKEGWN